MAGWIAPLLAAAVGPTYERSLEGAEAMYEIPPSPKAVMFVAHGCQHSATDFWEQTRSCPTCLGLPEEVRIRRRTLQAGIAFIALSSQDRDFSRCWSFENDAPVVQRALRRFRDKHGLSALPLAALGASSGGAFVLQLPAKLELDAVISQIMAIPPQMLPDRMPPTLFVHMTRDQRTAAFVQKDVRKLKAAGGRADHVEVSPQKPTAAFFVDRIEHIELASATMLHHALQSHRLLNSDGFLAEDPRRSPWREALRLTEGLVGRLPGPGLGTGGAPDSLAADESAVAECLNVAWAMHEIVSDPMEQILHFIWAAVAKRAGTRPRSLVERAHSAAEGELRSLSEFS